MSDDPGVTLAEILRRETEAVSEAAIQSRGDVASEQLERLQRLAKLVEIHESTRQAKARRRWPFAAALGITLLVMSALLFLHVPTTEIELSALVIEVGFTLPTSQEVFGSTALSALAVSSLQSYEFPGDIRHPARIQRPATGDNGDLAVRVASDSVGSRRGTIDLAPITLPAAARVRVQSSGPANEYRLSFTVPRDSVRTFNIHALGPVSVAATDLAPTSLDLIAPRGIVLTPDPGHFDFDLDLTFRTPIISSFSPQLSVGDLAFQRVDQTVDQTSNGGRTSVRSLSTILSGTVYFESLDGEQRQLRSGERLAFAQSRGTIQELDFRDGKIALRFAGEVRGMSTGFGSSSRSIMPTWLDWLRARHGLSLMWGATLYLFGLILTVARWWRLPR